MRNRRWGAGLQAAVIAISLIVCQAVVWGQQPKSQFVPVDQLPPQETLPGGPLLYAAYAFVWGAIVVYLFFLWRRIGRVERDLAKVTRTLRDRVEAHR